MYIHHYMRTSACVKDDLKGNLSGGLWPGGARRRNKEERMRKKRKRRVYLERDHGMWSRAGEGRGGDQAVMCGIKEEPHTCPGC